MMVSGAYGIQRGRSCINGYNPNKLGLTISRYSRRGSELKIPDSHMRYLSIIDFFMDGEIWYILFVIVSTSKSHI